jgi:hypothetical protein
MVALCLGKIMLVSISSIKDFWPYCKNRRYKLQVVCLAKMEHRLVRIYRRRVTYRMKYNFYAM